MAKKKIKVDGVSFQRDFVAGFKSEGEFIQAMSDKTYAHIFAGDNREAKLKEVYALVTPQEVAEAAIEEKPKGKK